ncbi:hypothetical protein NIIDNTM18_41950 [Mycolicibacterium litorale]|uniref:Uncharacterized protein n=1 Tax=Mycolicibacterium litorale TaxID=758802 RepID=A0A6S6PBC3_9MYCO|nr:hypothetical protein NIIDNTM18_41950 [Mycolicibacterium litorale]
MNSRRPKPPDRKWITGWVDYERQQAGVDEALDFLPVVSQRRLSGKSPMGGELMQAELKKACTP